MSLDIMRFRGQSQMTDEQKKADDLQLERAKKNVHVKRPHVRCGRCDQREVRCKCVDGFDAMPF